MVGVGAPGFVRGFVAFDGYLGRVSSHRTTSISITNNPALVRHSTLVRADYMRKLREARDDRDRV